MPTAVVQALKSRRELQEEDESKAKEYWQGEAAGSGLVFTTRYGTPVNDRNLARDFREVVCAKAVVGKWDLHECRHTFATLSLLAGVPIEQVARMLGHSDIKVTANTYAHVLPRHLESAVTALDDILGA